MFADTQRIGNDGQPGIHRSAGWEEAGVDDVKVIHFMCLAVHVQRAGSWIRAEPNRTVLVRDASERDALAQVQISPEKTLVAFGAVHWAFSLLLHQALKLRNEMLVAFFIVRSVLKYDVAIAIQHNSVIRVRQVLGREPEVERMSAHQLERPARRDRWCPGFECLAIELANERDVTHWIGPLFRAVVKIIHRKSLLKHCRVRTFRYGHQHGVDMPHVMAAYDAGAVRQTVPMFVVS
jgi:hypothetical protein